MCMPWMSAAAAHHLWFHICVGAGVRCKAPPEQGTQPTLLQCLFNAGVGRLYNHRCGALWCTH